MNPDSVKPTKKPSSEVRCMCKHGKCRKGESTCSKCDKGWTGMPLCDIKVEETPSKISRRKSDVENMSNQYSQQMKP